MSRFDLQKRRAAVARMLANIPSELYLYNAGDVCSAITGGWTNDYYVGTITRVNATLETTYLKAYIATGATNKLIAFGPNIAVDMTYYSKLVVNINVVSVPEGASIQVQASKDNTEYVVRDVSFYGTTGVKTVEIDISALSGMYYIRNAVYSTGVAAQINYNYFKLVR